MKNKLLEILTKIYMQNPECILSTNFNPVSISFIIFFHDKYKNIVRKEAYIPIDDISEEICEHFINDLKPFVKNADN